MLRSATPYRPIDEAARVAYADSASDVDPNLLIVSSLADDATRDHYPRAQHVSSLFQRFRSPDDRLALATTIGHHQPFITHRLVVESGEVPAARTPAGSACPYVHAGQLGVVRGQARVAQPEELSVYDRIRHFDPDGGMDDADVVFTTALLPVDPDGHTSRPVHGGGDGQRADPRSQRDPYAVPSSTSWCVS